jgi:peptidoglycan biosynthesis protein MviN/MurJ (putative lipid II flippase)
MEVRNMEREPKGVLATIAGAVFTILGFWRAKAKKRKIAGPDHLSTLMADLKFGVFFIVAGFLMWFLLVHVFAEEFTDAEMIISVGDWLLVLFVIIGILIIVYGIVGYAIAEKRHR